MYTMFPAIPLALLTTLPLTISKISELLNGLNSPPELVNCIVFAEPVVNFN